MFYFVMWRRPFHYRLIKKKEKYWAFEYWSISGLISHWGTPPHCLCSTWGCWVLQRCSRYRPKALEQDLSLWHTWSADPWTSSASRSWQKLGLEGTSPVFIRTPRGWRRRKACALPSGPPAGSTDGSQAGAWRGWTPRASHRSCTAGCWRSPAPCTPLTTPGRRMPTAFLKATGATGDTPLPTFWSLLC